MKIIFLPTILFAAALSVAFGQSTDNATSSHKLKGDKRYILDEAKAKALVSKVLKAAPIIDGHNDLFIKYFRCTNCPSYTRNYCEECPRDIKDYPLDKLTGGHTDIPRWRKGGVGGQLINIALIEPLPSFDLLHRLQETYPADLQVVGTAAEMRNAMKKGKIAILPTLEAAFRLENSMSTLRVYYKLGLRSVTMAYSTNDLADGERDAPRHNGLSAFGREMVKEMNRLGVLIDIAHTSEKSMLDIIEASEAPVIISHTSFQKLISDPPLITEQVLLRLKEKNGMIMLAFLPYYGSGTKSAEWGKKVRSRYEDFLAQNNNDQTKATELVKKWIRENPEPKVTLLDVADQYDYLKQIIGVNHIGIGSDFDGIPYGTVEGLEDVSAFPNLLVELARRGWSETELRKINSENFLRVFEVVEGVARQKQRTTEPSLIKLGKSN